jgi:YVTN family beta-propeller protein
VNAKGLPGGEYPFWVVFKANDTVFVSSIRDREIDVVGVSGVPNVVHRIKVPGQPNKMTLNADGSKLYVAEDQTDSVGIIDTATYTDTTEVKVGAPPGLIPADRAKFTGHNTNSVTLSPDGKTLYATNGNMNNVAVVDLNSGAGTPVVTGLIPTGWYPNSVSLTGDGPICMSRGSRRPRVRIPVFATAESCRACLRHSATDRISTIFN